MLLFFPAVQPIMAMNGSSTSASAMEQRSSAFSMPNNSEFSQSSRDKTKESHPGAGFVIPLIAISVSTSGTDTEPAEEVIPTSVNKPSNGGNPAPDDPTAMECGQRMEARPAPVDFPPTPSGAVTCESVEATCANGDFIKPGGFTIDAGINDADLVTIEVLPTSDSSPEILNRVR